MWIERKRWLTSMFSVITLCFTITWICCMLENKRSCLWKCEIEMLCFSSKKSTSEKKYIYIYRKREREGRRRFCKSSRRSRKVRRNLWIPDLSFVVHRPYSWRFRVKYARSTMEKGRLSPSPQGDRYTTIRAEDVVLILSIHLLSVPLIQAVARKRMSK